MTQAELALPPAPPLPDDPVGFQIGWDHAHHGLVPPPELLLEGTPIGQGWRAARAVLCARAWPTHRCTRQWLALRIEAWRCGAAFDLRTVTPNHLAQIEVRRCPVLRVPLGGAEAAPSAARIVRLNPQAAYAAGNLVMISRAADQAWQGLGVLELVRCARAAEALRLAAAAQKFFDAALDATHATSDAAVNLPAALACAAPGPAHAASAAAPGGADDPPPAPAPAPTPAPALDPSDAAAWWRLATLRSLATPLHAADAARLPLAVTPPNRARVLNAVQALQALLTARLTSQRWAAEMSAVAALLPAHSLRTDFNLWVGALAPRVLEAQARGRNLALALEDAWLAERVQRRWQHFALALGAPGCEQLVERLAGRQPGGRTAIALNDAQATEAWGLPSAQRLAFMALEAAGEPPPHSFIASPIRPSAASASAQDPAPAPRPGRRRTVRTPFLPPPRATADPRNAAT